MKVERITTLENLDNIGEKWNKFLFSSPQNCIFLTNEWFYSWWKCFSEDNSLEILIFKDEDENILGIAPFMSKERKLQFLASHEVSDYCDFITPEERINEFYENLLEYLKINYSGIDKIKLINIKYSSPTLKVLPELGSTNKLDYKCSRTGVAPFLVLPSSYRDYLARLGKKNRHELRRKLKRIESLKGVKILKITDTEELQTYTDDFISLHKKSSPSKAEFWRKKGMTDFFRELIYRFSQKRWIELNFLFYRDKIIAALLNFSFFDQIYFYNSTYDKEYAWYSPGLFLFNHCLKQAIHEGKREADFLRGEEKYKYNLGAKESSLFQIILSLK